MHKTLSIAVLASLLTVSTPFAVAQDSSYGMSMPDDQADFDSGTLPDRSTNPYIPQTWYQQRFKSPILIAPTRQVGPNSPAYQEDYAQ